LTPLMISRANQSERASSSCFRLADIGRFVVNDS
jgi:hypothetical protein